VQTDTLGSVLIALPRCDSAHRISSEAREELFLLHHRVDIESKSLEQLRRVGGAVRGIGCGANGGRSKGDGL
jgi:hypothetical protein